MRHIFDNKKGQVRSLLCVGEELAHRSWGKIYPHRLKTKKRDLRREFFANKKGQVRSLLDVNEELALRRW